MIRLPGIHKCISQGYISGDASPITIIVYQVIKKCVSWSYISRDTFSIIRTYPYKSICEKTFCSSNLFCHLHKWHDKPTCVLYWACTLLLIRSISRNVSSLPCFTSKSCHAFQKWAVNCKKKCKFIFPSIWEIIPKTNNLIDLPPWL